MGLDEAICCAGKSVEHILEILIQVEARSDRILLTRLNKSQFDQLPEAYRHRLDFDPLSATAFFPDRHPQLSLDWVAVVAGMDAALPTVLAGLINAPIIGVPTSVGYGVAEGGS